MNTTVLVTGGAGYIGSQTCKTLKAEGFTPVTLDNLVYGHEEAVRFGPFVKGDILSRADLDAAFETYRPAAVLHFAAFAYVGESVADPGKYYRNNVAGTLNLLEAMRDHGCRDIVFSSSCATYGPPQRLPLDETHPSAPMSPYGHTKAMSERMMEGFVEAHGLRSVALRYFNAAGADPDGELGEDHTPETHLIPLTIQAALGQRAELSIFGTDYDTPDKTAVRDYIHVLDLARAHVSALAHLQDNAGAFAFNLGIGQGFSVAEVVRAVEEISGRKVPVRLAERRAGDPARLVADASLARKTLGWTPEYTDPKEIIATAWAWHSTRAGA